MRDYLQRDQAPLSSEQWAVLDQAVVSGTSFATSVLLGRFASQQELGVYYLALSVVYFARGVQEQPRGLVERSGLLADVGAENVVPTLAEAWRRAREITGA